MGRLNLTATDSLFQTIANTPQSGFNDFSRAASGFVKQKKIQRHNLLKLRLAVSKILFLLSLSGLVVTVVNNELILLRVYEVCSGKAITLKILTTLLTVALILFVWIFNFIKLKIFMNLRSIRDLRTAMHVNRKRLILTVLETVVCAIHPLPVCIPARSVPLPLKLREEQKYMNTMTYNANDTDRYVHAVPELVKLSSLDAILSVLMFLRLYQIGRCVVLHSKLFRTMLSYSLGALAHTKYNFVFIFKSYMAIHKGYFLGLLAGLLTAAAAWCIYICDNSIVTYQEALWVVAITFFTVGYGDISPDSTCSQTISVLMGFFGMFCMGISVSILSRYLQLTFDEYCMLSFYLESDLEKQHCNASATVIAAAWQEYRSRRIKDPQLHIQKQRKLLKAFHMKKEIEYKRISNKERREKQVPLYDMKEQMKKLNIRAEYVYKRQVQMENNIDETSRQLLYIQEKLVMLYKLMQKDKKRI